MSKNNYEAVRVWAQAWADKLGYDFGLEKSPLFDEYVAFMLPRRGLRHGHELTCEVISPANIENTRPGHGYAK